MRASAVVKRQLALVWFLLRLACQAANFPAQRFLVRDAPVDALRGQDAQLGLCHIQPAAMLGRVVPFEALPPAALPRRVGRLRKARLWHGC